MQKHLVIITFTLESGLRGVFTTAKAMFPFDAWPSTIREWGLQSDSGPETSPFRLINQSLLQDSQFSWWLSLPLSLSLFLFLGPLAQGASFALLPSSLGPGSQPNLKEEEAFPESTVTPHARRKRGLKSQKLSLADMAKEENR